MRQVGQVRLASATLSMGANVAVHENGKVAVLDWRAATNAWGAGADSGSQALR